MHEYHYIRYHFVRRSDCTHIIYHGPSWTALTLIKIKMFKVRGTTKYTLSPMEQKVPISNKMLNIRRQSDIMSAVYMTYSQNEFSPE